ncbi:MAG: ribonuclease III [Clostridia bacterium]|nr:ribonuclease III [Clostridia bacterium]
MTLNLNLSNDTSCDPKRMSPLTLAFVGDSVFDLLVREMLVREANRPANRLHNLAVERVRAAAQADAARRLWEGGFLTDDEISVLKRGRNAHTNHLPKNASEQDYHLATGLEALFGYVYLAGDGARLGELFALVCGFFDNTQGDRVRA